MSLVDLQKALKSKAKNIEEIKTYFQKQLRLADRKKLQNEQEIQQLYDKKDWVSVETVTVLLVELFREKVLVSRKQLEDLLREWNYESINGEPFSLSDLALSKKYHSKLVKLIMGSGVEPEKMGGDNQK